MGGCKVLRRAIMLTVAVVLSSVGAAAEELPKNVLSAAALEATVKDWSIYGLTPSGNTFQVDYVKGGTLEGMTHKGGDSGKWWLKGNTLCRHWTDWSDRDGKEETCFVVALDKKCIHFHKPNGDWYRTWTSVAQLDPEDCDK